MMKPLKYQTAFLLIGLFSCGQPTEKHEVDTAAIQLNNQAMALVAFIDNPDSSRKAIALLDKATTIDSNYFLGLYNKLMFYNQLQEFDKAAVTVNKLIQLRPNAHDLYLAGGLLQERLGDTISSRSYFEKSLAICNSVLDTMKANNRDYEMLVVDKAVNLVMLEEEAKADELLKTVQNRQSDEEQKKWIASLMKKNKKQLLEQLTGDQFSR